MLRTVFFLAIAALLPALTASAEMPDLQAGERVRITGSTHSLDRARGTIISLAEDSICVALLTDPSRRDWAWATGYKRPGRRVTWLNIEELETIEVWQGQHGHPWTGALLGSVAGAGTGAVLGALATDSWFSEVELAVVSAVIGMIPGALFGAIIGAGTRTVEWKPARLSSGSQTDAQQGCDGIRVGIRLPLGCLTGLYAGRENGT